LCEQLSQCRYMKVNGRESDLQALDCEYGALILVSLYTMVPCTVVHHIRFQICICVTQALLAGTVTKTLMSVRSTPQCVSMVQHATTLMAHSCVHALLDTSAATVHCVISVTTTIATATPRETVASVSPTTTLRNTRAAVSVAGSAAAAKKLWSVTVYLLICEDTKTKAMTDYRL